MTDVTTTNQPTFGTPEQGQCLWRAREWIAECAQDAAIMMTVIAHWELRGNDRKADQAHAELIEIMTRYKQHRTERMQLSPLFRQLGSGAR